MNWNEHSINTELKEYRNVMGKMSWSAEEVQSEFSNKAMLMFKKMNSATIPDLWKVNKVIEKVKGKNHSACFRKLRKKEDLQLVGIGDASYKFYKKVIGGVLLLLTRASHLY